MFETTKVLLIENKRNLFKKIRSSPVLYFFFSAMMIFSIIMFAFLTFFLIKTEFEMDFFDAFFSIFFLFLLKSVADFHNFFIKSPQISYALSTQINQPKTIFEIFLAQFLINVGIWFSLSAIYLLSLLGLEINIGYPSEYVLFSIGVIIAIMLGCVISIFFFSSKRYRLLPTLILLGFYWFSKEILFIALTLPPAILHLAWSLKNAMPSHLFVNRKERTKERAQVKRHDILRALFYREITVLWRDKLLFSFVFTAISTAIFTGYLVTYGTEILIPESIRKIAEEYLPSMFVFLGIYVVAVYTSVFPSLNLFLNEEKTMWILRNIPVKNDTIVYGKALSLLPCFLTSIPFLAYIAIFIGLDQIVFLSWLLAFCFIAGVIISVPLGAKYVGKKSDILLLYSVAMMLFVILGVAATLGNFIIENYDYWIFLYMLLLIFEFFVLWLSLKLSSQILTLKS